MKSADLIARAAPYGVDLLAAARMTSNVECKHEIIIRRLKGESFTTLMPPRKNRANGKGDHSTVRPSWTMAELGQAAMGVQKTHFQAACYAYAGALSMYWPLHKALYQRVINLQQREKWPTEIKDIHGISAPYLDYLCTLVLDMDANPSLFLGDARLFAWYMRVTEHVWDKQLRQRYLQIEDIWNGWLGTASRIIQANLSGVES